MSVERHDVSAPWFALCGMAALLLASATSADPPNRVLRLGYVDGQVNVAGAGDSGWQAAVVNQPLVVGDQLVTENGARAELDVGAAKIRLDKASRFGILDLDDHNLRMELTEGTLNFHVRRLYDDQNYEVDTPTVAFVASEPGEYRVDIDAGGNATAVTVFKGAGTVYGEGGVELRLDHPRVYLFTDKTLRNHETRDLPRPDDFDNWCFARDERDARSLARRYVPEETIGSSDLDEYGDWAPEPRYGPVWYPRVDPGWAPYRNGYWSWVDPWGWTWIDYAPWGFAPFHYGRWVFVTDRWGWLPGPIAIRPVYAPALVAFIGGHNWSVGISFGDGPVGWCPLGPSDFYLPPYHVSRSYFSNVNITNIRNTTIINNVNITKVYNDYSTGRGTANVDYAYRRDPAAVTAVSRDAFVRARSVAAERLKLDRRQLASTGLADRAALALLGEEHVAQRGRARPASATRTRDNDSPTVAGPRAPRSERSTTQAQTRGAEPTATSPANREERQQAAAEKALDKAAAKARENRQDGSANGAVTGQISEALEGAKVAGQNGPEREPQARSARSDNRPPSVRAPERARHRTRQTERKSPSETAPAANTTRNGLMTPQAAPIAPDRSKDKALRPDPVTGRNPNASSARRPTMTAPPPAATPGLQQMVPEDRSRGVVAAPVQRRRSSEGRLPSTTYSPLDRGAPVERSQTVRPPPSGNDFRSAPPRRAEESSPRAPVEAYSAPRDIGRSLPPDRGVAAPAVDSRRSVRSSEPSSVRQDNDDGQVSQRRANRRDEAATAGFDERPSTQQGGSGLQRMIPPAAQQRIERARNSRDGAVGDRDR